MAQATSSSYQQVVAADWDAAKQVLAATAARSLAAVNECLLAKQDALQAAEDSEREIGEMRNRVELLEQQLAQTEAQLQQQQARKPLYMQPRCLDSLDEAGGGAPIYAVMARGLGDSVRW